MNWAINILIGEGFWIGIFGGACIGALLASRYYERLYSLGPFYDGREMDEAARLTADGRTVVRFRRLRV